MSATLTPATIDTLRRLLPADQVLIEVNGSFLRPETDYHIKQCGSVAQHKQTVAELLTTLPRPLVLYATKVDDAADWYRHLQLQGYQRIGLFTGDTPRSERQNLIDRWRSNQCDIMVATSAFGVGIDKADVRSIVHAAVPESLDRYYQECGRGGRDGHACVAFMAFHQGQIEVAQRMSHARLIGDEKGFARWQAMFARKQDSSVAELAVSLDVIPEHGARTSEANSAWNMRTLLLMQRSRLLKLHFAPPEPRHQHLEESDSDYEIYKEEYFKQYFTTVHVGELKSGHSSKDSWREEVSRRRRGEYKASSEDFMAMLEVLTNPNVSLCKLLQLHYRTDSRTPEYACGGCPGCRSQQKPRLNRILGRHVYSDYQHFGGVSMAAYYANSMDVRALILSLQESIRAWLASGQVQAIRTDEQTRKALYQKFQSSELLWFDLDMGDKNEHWHELVLQSPFANALYQVDPFGPDSILIAADNLPAPGAPYRLWHDCYSNAQGLSQFLKR